MKTDRSWQVVKSPQGRRWWSCGGVWRLPLRQHVIGSIFKRIRQAEKPCLAKQQRKVLAQNSCKVSVLSDGDVHVLPVLIWNTAQLCVSALPAWCDVTSHDRAQGCGWQHVQSDTLPPTYMTTRLNRQNREHFRLTFWMSDLSNSKIGNSQTGVKEGEKVYLSALI